jgi:hypothetical protein
MKLTEAFTINEGPLMGNDGRKIVGDFLEIADRVRNILVGSEQSRTPDAFGQGAVGQDKRGENSKAIELLDQVTDEIEKLTGINSPVPKDIEF